MVTMGRPQTDTGAIGAPEPGPLGLFGRHVEAFVSPDGLHAILPHVPALLLSEPRHCARAIPPILVGEGDDPLAHPCLTRVRLRPGSITRSDLPDGPTRPTLGDLQHGDRLPHRLAPTGRAQQCPAATSLSMLLSSDRSATSRFSRACSCSTLFSRFA